MIDENADFILIYSLIITFKTEGGMYLIKLPFLF